MNYEVGLWLKGIATLGAIAAVVYAFFFAALHFPQVVAWLGTSFAILVMGRMLGSFYDHRNDDEDSHGV